MANLPGQDADVYFGDTEKPLPDWRAEDQESDDDDDDEVTEEEHRAVTAILGVDPDELFPEEREVSGDEPTASKPPRQ